MWKGARIIRPSATRTVRDPLRICHEPQTRSTQFTEWGGGGGGGAFFFIFFFFFAGGGGLAVKFPSLGDNAIVFGTAGSFIASIEERKGGRRSSSRSGRLPIGRSG